MKNLKWFTDKVGTSVNQTTAGGQKLKALIRNAGDAKHFHAAQESKENGGQGMIFTDDNEEMEAVKEQVRQDYAKELREKGAETANRIPDEIKADKRTELLNQQAALAEELKQLDKD